MLARLAADCPRPQTRITVISSVRLRVGLELGFASAGSPSRQISNSAEELRDIMIVA